MNKYLRRRALLVMGIALANLGMPAFADSESFTEPYGSSSAPFAVGGSNFPVNLTLPQFNSLLGNLTQIQVTLNTTGLLQAEVANIGASTSFVNAQASGTITVSGPDGAQASVDLSTTPFSGSIASGTPGSATFSFGPETSLSGMGISDVVSSNFGTFETVGSSGTLEFPLNATFDGSFSGNGPSSLSFAGNAAAYGTVEIDYTYAASVPEPEELLSWSLVCLGGWKGFSRLRRARAPTPRTVPSAL